MRDADTETDDSNALQGAELHDVTVAATTSNGLEAIGLIELLEEAGIPAMQRGGLIHFGSMASQDIVVPRVRIDEARLLIADFRAGVSRGKIENAFSAEAIQEQLGDARRGPIVDQMNELSRQPRHTRDAEITPALIQWIADGVSVVEIAGNLAVAGYSAEEAQDLLKRVSAFNFEDLRERLVSRILVCHMVAALGFFGTVFSLLFRSQGVPLGAVMFVLGICLAENYKARLKAMEDSR